MKNFYNWLTDPKGAGKYAGRITFSIFAIMFLGIFTVVKLAPISADATSGSELNKDGEINAVRMASVEYVYTFEEDIDNQTKEAIMDYLYSTADAVKLLHMVNMRQHVVFGNYESISSSEDTIYCPIDVNVKDLNEAIDNLP